MAERPGILFYFSIIDDFKDYSDEEIGRLFMATMQYGLTGEVAEFEDRSMRTIFRNLMRLADRDQENFDNKILQRRYAGYKSALMKKGTNEKNIISFADWKAMIEATTVNDRTRPLTAVDSRADSCNEINQLSIVSNQSSIINNQFLNNNHSLSKSGSTEEKEGSGGKKEPTDIPFCSEPWKPLAEDEFERQREQRLEMLGLFGEGR